MFQSVSLIFGIAAMLSLINYKFLKLPYTIGLMILSILLAGIVYLIKPIFPEFYIQFCDVIYAADFEKLLFEGLLSFLLFAGALHINIRDLAKERWSVFLFASLGVIISTLIVGGSVFLLSKVLGIEITLIYCLLFGALISPTDPIAVLSILRESKISKNLELKIEGESLFNDGVGVVVFSAFVLLLPIIGTPDTDANIASKIGLLFLSEAIGGLIYGLALGYLGTILIKTVFDAPQLAVLVSLAIVMTGSALAHMMQVSAPLAMVVCGLVIGNDLDMNHEINSKSKQLLNEVWEVLDEVLNGIIFVLIGLVLHILKIDYLFLMMGVLAIVIVLAARFISIYLTYALLKHKEHNPLNTVKILTWGGLRGGISIALALSIGESSTGNGIILMTYTVVLFSIVVQGLSLGKLVRSLKN